MKQRAFVALFLAVSLLVPLISHAGKTSGLAKDAVFNWTTAYMRNTSASTVAQERNWAKGGSSPTGFADSTVFRRGATTATIYDTTVAYRIDGLDFPPSFGNTSQNALTDSTAFPSVYIRVRQDTTAYSYAATSALDSVRLAAEVSQDGINWFSCPGTPTQRFDTVFLTSGQDGLQSPTLVGVESSPGEDMAQFVLRCHPSTVVDNTRIINRSLCFFNGYVRFIIGGDYTGQFTVDLGTWHQN